MLFCSIVKVLPGVIQTSGSMSNFSVNPSLHRDVRGRMSCMQATAFGIITIYMELSKSQIQFYLDMFACTYYDVVSASLVSQRNMQRDIVEIRNRVAHEGISFLTKSLPRLGKIIDVSLGSGSTFQVQGFKTPKGSKIPKLFGGLLNVLFDADGKQRVAPALTSEFVSEETSAQAPACNSRKQVTKNLPVDSHESTWNPSRETMILALSALRQLCFLFYKLEIPHTAEQEDEVIKTFIQTDADLPESIEDCGESAEVILRVARGLIAKTLCNADPMASNPRHGKGAVATGESPEQKHRFKRFYRQLNAVFPYEDWFFFNASHLCDNLRSYLNAPEEDAGTAKVVLVPKDSRGPRLISCEPLEYQWVQQSLMRTLVSTLEQHPLTRGHVNFTNQEINRRLALEGSKRSDTYVTLDMKEASDRVSTFLVETLFPQHWSRALMSARSTRTRLPTGQVVTLKKFAPMGSAVCFPVEAFIFWSLAVAALHIYAKIPLNKAVTKVYVYGDDIVCDSKHYSIIASVLESFGLLLNGAKCCVSGFFRESCGMDAFHGASVTPVRLRKTFSPIRNGGVLSSYVAFHNAAYARGYVHTANYIWWSIQNIWNYTIPTLVGRTGDPDYQEPGCIAFVRLDAQSLTPYLRIKYRFNKDLHRKEVQGYRIRPATKMLPAASWGQMLEQMLKLADRPDGPSASPATLASDIEYPIAHRGTLSRAWSVVW